MVRLWLIAALAACEPHTNVIVMVPVYPQIPLAEFPPPPWPTYQPIAPAPVPAVGLTIPDLATRALAVRISETAARGDCDNATRAGRELEDIDREVNHALIAIDERYAGCVRGF